MQEVKQPLFQETQPLGNPQVNKSDVKVNPEVKSEEPKSPLAEQFQRIAKQEKFVSAERQKIDEARKAFEAEKVFAESYKGLKGKNPFEILEHFGIGYDELLKADKERSSPVDPAAKKALQEVERLRNELTSKEQEAIKAKMGRAEIQLQADIDKEVVSGEYDLIEKLDSKSAVREYMEEMYEQTGEIPSVKEACEAVTTYLVTKFESIKESKWFSEKKPPILPPASPAQSGKVITNKMAQSSEQNSRPLTEAERLAAAIRVMNSFKK